MNSPGARLIAGSFASVMLLAGCASSSTDAEPASSGHVIVGSGSAEDRQTIEASDQRMFQTEQGTVSSPAAEATASASSSGTPPTPTTPQSTSQ